MYDRTSAQSARKCCTGAWRSAIRSRQSLTSQLNKINEKTRIIYQGVQAEHGDRSASLQKDEPDRKSVPRLGGEHLQNGQEARQRDQLQVRPLAEEVIHRLAP